MVEYVIDGMHEGCYYDCRIKTIGIGRSDFYKLSEEEFSNYLSDAITHEYIHHLMHKYFNPIMSKLFDTIGHKFRNMSLLHKMINDSTSFTHDSFIKTNGIYAFLDYKGVNQEMFDKTTNASKRGIEKDKTWVEIFGMHYLRRFIDEKHEKVLRFNGSLFVQFSYLEEL